MFRWDPPRDSSPRDIARRVSPHGTASVQRARVWPVLRGRLHTVQIVGAPSRRAVLMHTRIWILLPRSSAILVRERAGGFLARQARQHASLSRGPAQDSPSVARALPGRARGRAARPARPAYRRGAAQRDRYTRSRGGDGRENAVAASARVQAGRSTSARPRTHTHARTHARSPQPRVEGSTHAIGLSRARVSLIAPELCRTDQLCPP